LELDACVGNVRQPRRAVLESSEINRYCQRRILICAYRVIMRSSRQQTLFRLTAIRAVADRNRRVITAVIGMNRFIASVRDIKMQHAADARTDGHERVITRIAYE